MGINSKFINDLKCQKTNHKRTRYYVRITFQILNTKGPSMTKKSLFLNDQKLWHKHTVNKKENVYICKYWRKKPPLLVISTRTTVCILVSASNDPYCYIGRLFPFSAFIDTTAGWQSSSDRVLRVGIDESKRPRIC